MNIPEQQQIDHWIDVSIDGINRKWKLFNSGFYEQENLPVQGMHNTLALSHASLARAKFLNGDPIEEVRKEFSKAAQCIIKSFIMAYDINDPDYVGDKWPPKNPNYTGQKDSNITAQWLDPGYGQVSWADVCETYAIEGMNYALISSDFDLAYNLASLFQNSLDGHTMDVEVNRYAHSLANVLKKHNEGAISLLNAQMGEYKKKPPKSGYRLNYYTLCLALIGILEVDEQRFNQGLLEHLKFYQHDAQGALKNTDEEFICDDAIALANLGIKFGLKITVEHDTLPKGLLINNS